MKKILTIYLISILCFNAYSQDTIYTNLGNQISSKVIEVNDQYIKFYNHEKTNNPIESLKRNKVFMIIYKDGRKELIKNQKIKTKNTSSFVDLRDKTSYNIVKIGKQWWMAENLNYQSNQSWCYDNSETNCDLLGRLYTWEAANNVCPDGWHLPSDQDWKSLEIELGMLYDVDQKGWRGNSPGQGKKLRSSKTTGFNALLAGYRLWGLYENKPNGGYFWTSTESKNNKKAWVRELGRRKSIKRTTYDKNYAFSVRCLKGDSGITNHNIPSDLKAKSYFVNKENHYLSVGAGTGASYGTLYGLRIQQKKGFGNIAVAVHMGGGVMDKYFKYDGEDPYYMEKTYLSVGGKFYFYRWFYFDTMLHSPTNYEEPDNFEGLIGYIFSFATTIGCEYSITKDFNLSLAVGLMDIGSYENNKVLEFGLNWKIIK